MWFVFISLLLVVLLLLLLCVFGGRGGDLRGYVYTTYSPRNNFSFLGKPVHSLCLGKTVALSTHSVISFYFLEHLCSIHSLRGISWKTCPFP